MLGNNKWLAWRSKGGGSVSLGTASGARWGAGDREHLDGCRAGELALALHPAHVAQRGSQPRAPVQMH